MGRSTGGRTIVRNAATRITALASAAALAASTAAIVGVTAAASPTNGIHQTVVFESGTEGYDTFRIPAITRATDGTLLAFAEGRVEGGGDTGDIDLVLRRSTDNGRTWGQLQVVGDNGPNVFGNPAPVIDPATGDVVLLTTHNAGHVTEAQIMRGEVTPEESRRVFVQRSADHGQTWSEAIDITADTKDPDWRWYATGPVHGIALEHGPHAGRLVIPANHSTSPDPGSGDTGQEPYYYGGHVLYSDDGGHSWQIGGIDTPLDGVVNPNETTAVELADGTIYFNTRDHRGTSPTNRAATTSRDGGASFDRPYEPVSDLVAPIVQGAVFKLSRAADRHERLVFSAPGHPSTRHDLTLRSSFDDGASWAESLVVHHGPAAYSDLVETSDRFLGVLYENGDQGTYERITFARIPAALLDLDDPPEPPPWITPDHSGHANHGLVHGPRHITEGVFGSALTLEDGYVEVPFADSLAIGADPFTAATWFRTSDQSAQALMWAFGVGGGAAQWWVRVEPANNRVRALIETDQGVTSIAAPGNFANGDWHHLALVRDDTTFTLYIDGAPAASTPSIAGTLTANPSTGVHLGQRPDGANRLVGDLDEAWMFASALTATEIATLMADNTAPASLIHLPLDNIVKAPRQGAPKQ
jgi:sialidase-1